MAERATLVASLLEVAASAPLAPPGTDVLEIRGDLAGEVEATALRERFAGRLLYTLRSAAEGGAGPNLAGDRAPALHRAAASYDLVDLELDRDLEPELLEALPAERRIVSWHGPASSRAGLEEILERMLEVGGLLYKLVPAAADPLEALAPLELLAEVRRSDVVAFAGGEAGLWTRPIAPLLGAPWVYGATSEPAASGQPVLDDLILDYGLPELPAATRLYGVVGSPVSQSLSPRLHNGLYRLLGVEALYVPFEVEHFGDFWLEIVEAEPTRAFGLPLEGLSVTAPHKSVALAVSGASSPLAERVGAANTLVRRRGVWEAEATDPQGVTGPLADAGVDPRGRRAAVLGAGGAGISAAVGLSLAGARVELFNRSLERARRVAARLGLAAAPLEAFDAERFEIVVNATPVGRSDAEAGLFDIEDMAEGSVLFDMAYRRHGETRLVERARERGLVVVDGRTMLLHQAGLQFRMMTGLEFPLGEARRLIFPEATARPESDER